MEKGEGEMVQGWQRVLEREAERGRQATECDCPSPLFHSLSTSLLDVPRSSFRRTNRLVILNGGRGRGIPTDALRHVITHALAAALSAFDERPTTPTHPPFGEHSTCPHLYRPTLPNDVAPTYCEVDDVAAFRRTLSFSLLSSCAHPHALLITPTALTSFLEPPGGYGDFQTWRPSESGTKNFKWLVECVPTEVAPSALQQEEEAKRSKRADVPCLLRQQHDEPAITEVPGLYLYLNEIDETTAASLQQEVLVEAQRTGDDLCYRRVTHFGHPFDYRANAVDTVTVAPPPGPLLQAALDRWSSLPVVAAANADVDDAAADAQGHCPLNQVTVNEYSPGTGIPQHVEAHASFGGAFVALSLGSGVRFEMTSMRTGASAAIYLPPRSLLVVSGPARYEWTHGIRARATDVVGTETLRRGHRMSITARQARLPPRPCRCDAPAAACDSKRPAKPQECHLSRLEEQNVRQVYEQIAPHFSQTRRSAAWPAVGAFLDALPPRQTVLDLGGGNGRHAYVASLAGHWGVNLDAAHAFCRISRSLHNLPSITASMLEIPLRSGTVDAITCIAALHHLSTAAHRATAVAEMLRILTPGGRAIIYVWAKEQPRFEASPDQDVLVPWHSDGGRGGGVVHQRFYHLFMAGELEGLCAAQPGCVIVDSFMERANHVVILEKRVE